MNISRRRFQTVYVYVYVCCTCRCCLGECVPTSELIGKSVNMTQRRTPQTDRTHSFTYPNQPITIIIKSKMDQKVWQWSQTIDSQTYLISTARDLLPHTFVREAFATPAMFWAKPLSPSATKTMLDNSLTLGLYLDSKPIGMARMVTDYVTLAYLTDVYIQDAFRDMGLGTWIIRCCREIVLEMPDLRFMVLLTGSEEAQRLYKRELGMKPLDGTDGLTCMGARKEGLELAAAGVNAGSFGQT
jgi:hypothetical protein